MGYHAPSASEVYRYLFHLDHSSEISLGDGFSWSILFLNDSSLLCREFLIHYGAELCYRTADRIRFVFFSEIPDTELDESGAAAHRAGGFLNYVLRTFKMWGNDPRYKWERDDWTTLRPQAFHPLETQKSINRQISFEAQLYSAMPGSREAHRLAQELGVGRFVPCFLLFADIGQPTVRLFPIADKSPSEVYRRLRVWIDSFYEINQAPLARWSSIEESIKRTVSRLNTSLSEVAAWRRKRKEQWDVLQGFSRYIDRIADGEPDASWLRKFLNNGLFSWEMRSSLAPFLEQLEKADQRKKDAREVAEWLDNARTVVGVLSVRTELVRFNGRFGSKAPRTISALVEEAIKSCDPIEPPGSPQSDLVKWWRSEFGRTPSRNRYEKHRLSWVSYSREKYGADAVGNIARIVGEEFAVIQQAALDQPVLRSAELASQEVINRLANHLNVAPDDNAWLKRVSDYRQVLTDYFTNLRNHVPVWLTALQSESTPELRWKDCVPGEEARKKRGHRKALDELPVLSECLKRATNNHELMAQKMEAEHLERLNRSLGQLFSAIDDWLASISLTESDKVAIRSALVASLSSIRQKLENRAFENARTFRRESYPGEMLSEAERLELTHLLDEYERIVNSVRFPFESDSEVMKVSLRSTLIEASRLDLPYPSGKSVAQHLKIRLFNVAEEAATSERDWESLQREAHTWTPTGRLWTALNKVLSRSSIEKTLMEIGANGPADAVHFLASREKIVSLLDALPVQALTAVENAMIGQKTRGDSGLATTKQALYDSILLAIGLVPSHHGLLSSEIANIPADKAQMLRDKVAQGVFDIFLAHNSEDRPLVQRLAQELRRHGIYPWLDVEQIAPGRWFQDVIQSAIRTVKSAAVIIGRSGVGRWQTLELRTFLNRCVEHGVPLIPVLLPGMDAIPDDLIFLRELNHVRFTNDVTESEALSNLIWGITGIKPIT